MPMKLYQCQKCGVECGGNAEAEAEAEKLWGVPHAESKIGAGMGVVCEDCFQQLMNFKKN